MLNINGITYFSRKNKPIYPGDERKGCGLTADELDQNFYFLRGKDVSAFTYNESDGTFTITLNNGDELTTTSISGSVKDFMSGVIDEILCDISGLTDDLIIIREDISGLTDELYDLSANTSEEFKNYVRKDEVLDHVDSASTLPVQSKVLFDELSDTEDAIDEVNIRIDDIVNGKTVVGHSNLSDFALADASGNTITESYGSYIEYDASSSTITLASPDGTVLSVIDTTDFVIDGMIEDVCVSGGNIVITFNVDAGKKDIIIPLTDIVTVDGELTEDSENPVQSKAIYQVISENEHATSAALNDLNSRIITLNGKVESDKVYSDATYFSSAEYDNVEKQVILKSNDGTKEVTIDASPFLKDGMLESVAIRNIEGSGDCIVFEFNEDAGKEPITVKLPDVVTESTVISGSTNPVQSKAVYDALKEVEFVTSSALNDLNSRVSALEEAPSITVDAEITSASTNPVESKAIYEVISSNEKVTATALCDLDERIHELSAMTDSFADKSECDEAFGEISGQIDDINARIDEITGVTITIDSAITSTSTNPVQSKVLYEVLKEDEMVTSAALDDLDGRITDVEESVSNLDTLYVKKTDVESAVTENSQNPVSSGAVYKVIVDNELTIASALCDLDDRIIDATEEISKKQNTLVSGTNIKTINNQSLLGSGNITIEGGSGDSLIRGIAEEDWTDTNEGGIEGQSITTKSLKSGIRLLATDANEGPRRLVITYNNGSGDVDVKVPLSDYVYTKNEVDDQIKETSSLANYYTKDEVNDIVDSIQTSGTDLTNYYTKAQTEDKINEATANTQAWVSEQNYLTEHQSLNGYATEEWVKGQGYLTEHQDISGLATKDELTGFTTTEQVSGLIDQATATTVSAIEEELAEVATSGSYNDLTDKPTIPSKTSDLTNDSGFITSSDIPSLEGYATEDWVNEQGYLKEHQDISGLATKDELTGYTKTEQVDSLITTAVNSLANVARSGSYADLINQPNIPSKTSELDNDSNFITEDDLSGYAKTSDLDGKQDVLVSGVNIKTINGVEILGEGNISISGGDGGGEANVIESISVNGVTQPVSNKTVNISVPTKTSDLPNDSDFVVSSALSTVALTGSYNDLLNKPTIPDISEKQDVLPNSGILSTITQSDVDAWDNASAESHTHTNKFVLDAITQESVEAWNTVSGKADKTDLASYPTKSELTTTLEDYAKSADLTDYATKSDIQNFVTEDTLSEYALINDIPTSGDTAKWDAASDKAHEHDNKDVLDGISATKVSNWDIAYSSAHTHTNKSVLDDITQESVEAWNTVSGKADKSDIPTSEDISKWNAASDKAHEHDNKDVLDGISADDITNWNSKTSNVGTVTGVKMNGTTNNPTDGVVDLGTVITEHQQLSTINGSGLTGGDNLTIKENVQSDWNATTGDAVIRNKPSLDGYATKTEVSGVSGSIINWVNDNFATNEEFTDTVNGINAKFNGESAKTSVSATTAQSAITANSAVTDISGNSITGYAANIGISGDSTTGFEIKLLDKDGNVINSVTIPSTGGGGSSSYADNAGKADKATSDEDGNNIKNTYAVDISSEDTDNVIKLSLTNKNNTKIGNGTDVIAYMSDEEGVEMFETYFI